MFVKIFSNKFYIGLISIATTALGLFFIFVVNAGADESIHTFVVSKTSLNSTQCLSKGASNGSFCFTDIQSALNTSKSFSGLDTILVDDGIYAESLIIEEGNEVEIKSINGKNLTTINSGTAIGIDINAQRVTISDLTINSTNSTGPTIYVRPTAISATDGKSITIKDSTLSNTNSDVIYVLDPHCNNCSNRISISNNQIHSPENNPAVYIDNADNVAIVSNTFTTPLDGDGSKFVVVQETKGLNISNNIFDGAVSQNSSYNASAIVIGAIGGDDTTATIISGNTFRNITGEFSSAIYLQDLSTDVDIENLIINSNTFETTVDSIIDGFDLSNSSPKLKVDLSNNVFDGLTTYQMKEDRIHHNCIESKVTYAGHFDLVCGPKDNNGKNSFLLIRHAKLDAPTFLGWNSASNSATPNEFPLDLVCDNSSQVITSSNSIAHNWTQVNGPVQVKYLVNIKHEDSTEYNFSFANNFTSFSTWGTPEGMSGLWEVKVSAFWDADNNGSFDDTDDRSDWSNVCNIIYDTTKPEVQFDNSELNFIEGIIANPFEIGLSDNFALGEVCYRTKSPSNIVSAFECQIASGDNANVQIPSTLPNTIDTSIWEEGEWEFEFFARDLAGNISDSDDATIGDNYFSKNVTVENVSPTVFLSLSQYLITEHDSITITGNFTDPSSNFGQDDAPWNIFIDYGLGSNFELIQTMNSEGNITPIVKLYDRNGTFTVRLRVCEDSLNMGEGMCSTHSRQLEVSNNAPGISITSSPSTSVNTGEVINLSNVIVGGNSPYTYEWSDNCTGANPSTTFTSQTAGVFNCSLKVTDKDGDIAQANVALTINAIPNQPNSNNNQTQQTPNVVNTGNSNAAGENGEVLGAEDDKESEENKESESDSKENEKKERSTTVLCKEQYLSGRVNNKENSLNNLFGIKVEITTSKNDYFSTITDENGNWKISMCEGRYYVKVSEESINRNYKLITTDQISVILQGNDVGDINFELQKSMSLFPWILLLLLIPLIIGLIALFILYRRRKNNEEKVQPQTIPPYIQ